MKIIKANIYLLSIPFKVAFGHYLKEHSFSDSIIVELISESGIRGYGEGVARNFVTGETADSSAHYMQEELLPSLVNVDLSDLLHITEPLNILSSINMLLPRRTGSSAVTWNASRAAVEIALIDCILRSCNKSLSFIMPSRATSVTYSGVISSGNLEKTVEFARRCRDAEMQYIKIKVGSSNDHERIGAIRDILGPSVSLRLDANGAFELNEAVEFINSAEKYGIDSIEQPLKKGNEDNLAEIRRRTSIPVMVDESLVTINDAKRLIDLKACDYFNLRISKCGGLLDTLSIANMALDNGIKIQLGCHVGETAVLSAAGRFLAAYLSDVRFVEGSFSTYLLAEDISAETMTFGRGGHAPQLTGNGLGVHICEDLLRKYARKIISVD